MTEIADLTDQKQQLEHLVLQLQGETETIGDYIALYQVQRGLMKKWAAEKDDYIAQLSRDREELKDKLRQLQSLIVNLVNKKQLDSDQNVENISNYSRSTSPFNHSNRISPALNHDTQLTSKEWDALSNVSSDVMPSMLPNSHLDNQAKKIIDLISDIGSTALVDKPVLDTFHPCVCCSGRLINV